MKTLEFIDSASLFEINISKALENVWDYIDEDNNTNWTRAINRILWQSVKEFDSNNMVAASKLETSDCREWLFDFVCYQNNSVGLDYILFIAECECKNPRGNIDYLEEVQYDFEKLFVAKAPYRLMIFEGDSKEEIIDIINHLILVIKLSKLTNKNDRFMFAAWIKCQEFYVDIYIHK